MPLLTYNNKSYGLDADGFLIDADQWDEDFPVALSRRVNIFDGLTEKHWNVIKYIRQSYERKGRCPLIYETCRANELRLASFKKLFPTGYLRGACRLAGITYADGFIERRGEEPPERVKVRIDPDKVYPLNGFGFLVDPYAWDSQYAELKAFELKMPEGLTDDHWHIIHFLRDYYFANYGIPGIYETCEANGLELDDLEKLFPDGYHRGAVKIAGLRVR